MEPYDSTLKFKNGGYKKGKRQDFIEVYEVCPVLAALLITHREQYLKLLALSKDEACLRMLLDFSLQLSGADFTGIPLQLATFTGADFSGAVFTDEQRRYLKTTLAENKPLLSWIKQKSSGQCLALQFSEKNTLPNLGLGKTEVKPQADLIAET